MPEKYPEVIVSTFIINDRKELFLVKGAKWQNQYVIPGGHLNYAETLEDCCKREVDMVRAVGLLLLMLTSSSMLMP